MAGSHGRAGAQASPSYIIHHTPATPSGQGEPSAEGRLARRLPMWPFVRHMSRPWRWHTFFVCGARLTQAEDCGMGLMPSARPAHGRRVLFPKASWRLTQEAIRAMGRMVPLPPSLGVNPVPSQPTDGPSPWARIWGMAMAMAPGPRPWDGVALFFMEPFTNLSRTFRGFLLCPPWVFINISRNLSRTFHGTFQGAEASA